MMTACYVKTSLIREMLSMLQRTGVLFCVSSIHYFFCKPELINITFTKKCGSLYAILLLKINVQKLVFSKINNQTITP